jgi:hypothetical protein
MTAAPPQTARVSSLSSPRRRLSSSSLALLILPLLPKSGAAVARRAILDERSGMKNAPPFEAMDQPRPSQESPHRHCERSPDKSSAFALRSNPEVVTSLDSARPLDCFAPLAMTA